MPTSVIRFQSGSLEEIAKNRKPGYLQAVYDASTVVDDKTMQMSREDYVRIAEKYSLGGPGSELKKLLKLIGITATPNCKCNQRAKYMDKMGPAWCRENLDTILDWLQEESSNRGMLFVRSAARLMVNRAITTAERNNA